jgi:putative membrane protein
MVKAKGSMNLGFLPHLNAVFNLLSTVGVCVAYLAIRRGNLRLHQLGMISAVGFSALFLAGYLWFHFQVGMVRFGGQGLTRTIYFWILTTHTILAAVMPFAVFTQVWAALKKVAWHRRWGHWIAFAWLYVSLTGIIIYLFLRSYLP